MFAQLGNLGGFIQAHTLDRRGRGKVFLPCRLDKAYDYEIGIHCACATVSGTYAFASEVKGVGGIMLLLGEDGNCV